MSRLENKNGWSTRWASKRSGKKSGSRPTIIRSMVKKERGGRYTRKNTSRVAEPSPVLTDCRIKIIVACTYCNVTNTLCL